jgi:hypothetical protein
LRREQELDPGDSREHPAERLELLRAAREAVARAGRMPVTRRRIECRDRRREGIAGVGRRRARAA